MSTNKTTNLDMHSWVGTDRVRRSEINDNFDILDEAIGDMAAVPTTAKDAAGAITELFQSVSDGKEGMAGAFTDIGLPTSATDTFATMKSNVLNTKPNLGVGWKVLTSEKKADGGKTFRCATYGNGLFVIISLNDTTTKVSADNGVTWTTGTITSRTWNGIAFGKGLFVAVAADGSVATSPNGLTWTERTPAAANNWTSICFGGGQFVAVSRFGTNRVMTSPDGITWTSRTSADEASTWTSVCYSPELDLYVAVANSGTNRVMTSPDGVTWTARTAAEANNWTSVYEGNGLYVAVANNGTNRIMTSSDGITWTARTYSNAHITDSWLNVRFGMGVFISVAGSGTNRIMTSPDGITWTSRSTPTPTYYSLSCVVYGNATFLAVNGNSSVSVDLVLSTGDIDPLYQADKALLATAITNKRVPTGSYAELTEMAANVAKIRMRYDCTFTRATLAASSLYGVCYGGGQFVAVGNSSINFMTSPDGVTWTARTVTGTTNNFLAVCYGSGLYVAVSNSRVATSSDGITWTNVAALTGSWSGITYGAGLFIAVGYAGSGQDVMTSPDGVTWTLRTTPSGAGFMGICYGNGQFVATGQAVSQAVLTSPDGATWTARTSPEPTRTWGSVCYSPDLDLYVSVCSSSDYTLLTKVMTSPDGITWTLRTTPVPLPFFSVCYGNGKFIAIEGSASFRGNQAAISLDGVEWAMCVTPYDAYVSWNCVCFGNDLFVAVANSGGPTTNRIMTSDGIT